MKPETTSTDQEARLLQAARDYLAELESGQVPDRQAYLARYPELADELPDCLDGIELAHAAGEALDAPVLPQPEYLVNTLGDFQILREIGRGGMGVVYEAVQLSLGRRVALKTLPFAAGLDATHLQRFKVEAQAAAGLHHTNIVPVHAVGCERGVHFYAMQLIEGHSLDAVIRERRGSDDDKVTRGQGDKVTRVSSTPSVTPSPGHLVTLSSAKGRAREHYRWAAQIAVQVAEALEHAHAAGVVHRDIKPANLLLDARGTVWVTDFGLAQVSDVSLTRSGDLVGTLRYMSPEQAAGQSTGVDHRTDVYSLGATLYELLTLEPIFSGQDRRTLLHQILDEEPRPPRQLDRAIPIELETIVLKSLAKVPQERYATAGEMAADLRRFLDERPILARRPTLVERARKWMRRHPSFVAAAFLLLVFIALSSAVAALLVSQAQARTQAALDQSEKRAREAEVRFRLAQSVANELIAVSEEELVDKPQMESLRKRLLEAAFAYYEEFIALCQDDPGAQAELAETRDRVENILCDLTALQVSNLVHLLKEAPVARDLKLSAEERTRVAELHKRLDEQRKAEFDEFRHLGPDERGRRMLAVARKTETAVEAVLRPERITRLRQIALQRRGPEAFREPDVAARLKLTAAQRTQIRGVEFGGPPGRCPPHMPPEAMIEQRKEALEKILAVLTPKQRVRWQELTGAPYEGPMFIPGPGWPNGPGPKGPRGQNRPSGRRATGGRRGSAERNS